MKKKNKMILLISVTIILTVVIVQRSLAYFTSESIAINKFLAGSTDIEVEEEFIPPETWDGSVVGKKVQITNNTDTKSLVRVSITPRWITIIENEDGSQSEIPFSGDTSSNTVTLDFTDELTDTLTEGKWFKGTDGYYYYINILEGMASTSILLESVSLTKGVVLPDEYKDKSLYVDVKAETVQATNHDVNNDGINDYQFKEVWLEMDQNVSTKLESILDK